MRKANLELETTVNTKKIEIKRSLPSWVKTLGVVGLLISSLMFYVALVQPAIHTIIANKAAKILSGRNGDLQTAARRTKTVAQNVQNYFIEYGRQDCDIDVTFSLDENKKSLDAIVANLNPTVADLNKVSYGPLQSGEINRIKESAIINMVQPATQLLTTANNYTDMEGLVRYLQQLRKQCGVLTSPTVIKNTVAATHCPQIANIVQQWKEPQVDWVRTIWVDSNKYSDICNTKDDYNTTLDKFLVYFNKLFDSAPDTTEVDSSIQSSYDLVQKITADSREELNNLSLKRSSFPGTLFLLIP